MSSVKYEHYILPSTDRTEYMSNMRIWHWNNLPTEIFNANVIDTIDKK